MAKKLDFGGLKSQFVVKKANFGGLIAKNDYWRPDLASRTHLRLIAMFYAMIIVP